ncbi:hypothetical protein D9613_001943 [Agrocybe pediades]|uniref:Uncharacterized protein n=1 Tax=Agrocybe pediades TaxID=84607 RepID=A0A8H4R8Q4_9AGAR|nr:hypothetical protein D9613_001943 [Agrocybe pediades]
MHSMFRRYFHYFPRINPKVARTGVRLASSSFVLRVPPQSAPRESPTPLVFLSVSELDNTSNRLSTVLASMLAEKGFTCIETDLKIPQSTTTNSQTMVDNYESELKSVVRLTAIPFPPVIVAQGLGCLVAQTYISSNPATGMVLISPPVSNEELDPKRFPSPLQEFNYEPEFPIAVIATPEEVSELRERNRICQSENVDVIPIKELKTQQVFTELELWLDKLGI